MHIGRMREHLAMLQGAGFARVRWVSHFGRSIKYGSEVELQNTITDHKARFATPTTGIPRR